MGHDDLSIGYSAIACHISMEFIVKLNVALIFSLSFSFFSVQQAFAQRAEAWSRNYQGTPSFRLIDDSRMAQLTREENAAQARMNPVNQQIAQLRQQIQAKRQETQTLQNEIQQLQRQITQSIQEKNQAQANLNRAEQNLTQKQEDLRLARVAAQTLNSEIEELKTLITRDETRKATVEQQCQANPNDQCRQQLQRIEQRLQNNTRNLAQKEELAQAAQNRIDTAQASVQEVRTQVRQLTATIERIDNANSTRAEQVAVKQRAAQENQRLFEQLNNQLQPLIARQEQLARDLAQATNRLQAYEDLLVQRILAANQQGAELGRRHGQEDGQSLASNRAFDFGVRDGSRDGERDGRQAGRDRAYQEGLERGERAGTLRAQQEGTRDGERAGVIAGNQDAGQTEGVADGQQRARQSDATQVGQRQGEQEGQIRAVQTGKTDGERQGQQQALDQLESDNLPSVQLQGAYLGTFNRQSPAFPQGYLGPQANAQAGRQYQRPIVRQAFVDGHLFRYRPALRNTYIAEIDQLYSSIYSQSYSSSYNEYINQSYPQDELRGFQLGESRAFDRNYDSVRNQAFNASRSRQAQFPDRQSTEFQQAFAQNSADTYSQVYEQIRRQAFDQSELQTFQANIAEQTEIYRQSRLAAVTQVYQEHAVLKFNDHQIAERGLRGVGANDGIYMPDEAISHQITLTNYGFKEANNVQIVLNTGEKTTLPTIPARSVVTITDAAKSYVADARTLGRTQNITLSTLYPLTSTDSVQGRHYTGGDETQVNAPTSKSINVRYPVNLNRLSLNNVAVFQVANPLTLSVANIATRSLQGPLKIEVNTNARTNVIQGSFNELTRVEGQQTLTGASLLVADQRDAYSQINIQAKASINGVTVGVLAQPLSVVAKAPYVDRAGKPVIIANSDSSMRDLLDMISEFNGIENVSIVDTSIMALNQSRLNSGLKDKTLLVIERNALQQVDRLLAQSENIAIMMVDDQNNGLTALSRLRAFANGLSVNFRLNAFGEMQFLSSNKVMNTSLKGHNIAFQSSPRLMKRHLTLADTLRLSNGQLVNTVRSQINLNGFLNPSANQRLLLEAMNVRILTEIGVITKTYTDSGGGLFGGSRDRDIADRLREDNSMLHNILIRASNVSANSGNIGLILAGLDSYRVVKNALSDHPSYSRSLGTTAVNNRLFGALTIRGAYRSYERDVLNKIRSFNSNLRTQMQRNTRPLFAPFTPAEPRNNN
jgi:predicted  nucleic acid-binding Zn-ribbon protein